VSDGKVYAPAGNGVWVFPPDRLSYALEHHVLHSPDGHSWGYSGSGPSELAKDILWDLLGEQPSQELYFAFRERFIATIPQQENDWRITEWEIRLWMETEAPMPMSQPNEAGPGASSGSSRS
jgi:hypothetical protein